jgi:hypothetical protein
MSARFTVDVTRYLVYRQGEWGFYVTLDAIEADGIDIGIYFMHRDVRTLSPRWTSLKAGEGFAVGLERLDGTEEDVVITLNGVECVHAILKFELPDGAKLEQVEDDNVGSPDAG